MFNSSSSAFLILLPLECAPSQHSLGQTLGTASAGIYGQSSAPHPKPAWHPQLKNPPRPQVLQGSAPDVLRELKQLNPDMGMAAGEQGKAQIHPTLL